MPRLTSQGMARVRDRIAVAALRRFVTRGYASTTTREIAEDAGMTAGALYVHYPSKEALFKAVVGRYRKRLSDEDNPLLGVLRHTRFPDDLEELAAAIGKLVRMHRDYWTLWYVDVLEFEGKHFRSALAPRAILQMPEIRRRLQELRKSRRLRIKPEIAFILVYMDLFNYFLIEVMFGGKRHFGVSEPEAVRIMAEVHLHGLLAPSPRNRRGIPRPA